MKYTIFFLALMAIIIASCNHNHEDDQAHNDEGEKIQLTAYSDQFELFAEADLFEVGKQSNILSHFSNLPYFTALENGSINIRLIVKGTEVSQTLDQPTRKGIYSFNIIPKTAGKGELIFEIKTNQGDFEIIIPSIEVFADDHDAIHLDETSEPPPVNAVVFTKEQSWKIDFATTFPELEPFGRTIKTTALVQSAQGDEVIVTAKTNGIVMLSANHVLIGKSVSKGQVLFSISGSGLANNNSSVQFQEANNNYLKAKADYERTLELAKEKIVSEKELLNAKYQYKNAKLVYDNLNKNFNSDGQNVMSPMTGFVKQLFAQNGQYIKAGQSVLSVSQNITLMLTAEVQQKHAPVLANISSATIHTLHDNNILTLEDVNGKIVSFGRTTNDQNYLIPVNLQIDNHSSFIPGGFVEVYLKTKTDENALIIPNNALIEEQGSYFVFVQITPELFEKREIKPGSTDGLKTEILSGLSENERIVSKGAMLIKLAQATGTLDAHSGHVH